MNKCFPLFCLTVLALGLNAGCQAVKPWQRGTLADYTMRGDRSAGAGPARTCVLLA